MYIYYIHIISYIYIIRYPPAFAAYLDLAEKLTIPPSVPPPKVRNKIAK